MIRVKGDPTGYKNFLKQTKQNFSIRRTSGTTILTNSQGVKRLYYRDDLFSFKDLAFMRRLRKNIEESEAYAKLKKAMDSMGKGEVNKKETLMLQRSKMENIIEFGISPLAVRYFDFDDSIYSLDLERGCVYEYENVKECDITRAYYYAAYQLGVFTEEFFKECLTLPKAIRLKMMGAMAANVVMEEYVEGRIDSCYVMNDKYLRAIWFSICRYVDQCMRDIKNFLVKEFIFYWVDGIYYKDTKGANVVIESVMKAYGFDHVITDIEKMTAENRGGDIVLNIKKKHIDKPVIFNVPKNKVRGYYLGDPLEAYVINDEKIFV